MDNKANAASASAQMIFVLGFEGLKFGLELWNQPQWVGVSDRCRLNFTH